MIFDYYKKKKRLKIIKIQLEDLVIWKNLEKMRVLKTELDSLNILVNSIDQIYIEVIDLRSLLELTDNYDIVLISEINTQLINVEHKLSKLEFLRMFSKKDDIYNCYIDIQSGSGGVDAQSWSSMLLRMYLRWSERKGFFVEVNNESLGETSGIKSATIRIAGVYAYGWLRTESGIHRLVRKSPFDSSGKRHTSFASVFVYPELDESIDINIRSEDLRFDVYKASGAGGQHVNRTESAVRITHIPTNIVTQCQSDRSQHKNKNQAMKQLKAKLYEFELQKKILRKKTMEGNKLNITWGNQIRSYILDRSKVKDLRTGLEKNDVKTVLNGDLDDFMKASIKQSFERES